MVFEHIWRDPDLHINKGRQWHAFSDQLSADDMNFIVSNLNFVNDRIIQAQGTIVYVNGKPVMTVDVSSLFDNKVSLTGVKNWNIYVDENGNLTFE